MKDTLAHVLERKCSLKVSEAKKLAEHARQNLELPQTFLWSKELEKEAIRLCYEQNPNVSKEEIPKTLTTLHTEEPPSKVKDQRRMIFSPRRRCQKQSVAMVGKSDTKSPIKKKKKMCSEQYPHVAKEAIPMTATLHTDESPSKAKEEHRKIVSPRRRCEKQSIIMVGKSDAKSPSKKKKKTCSSRDFVDVIAQKPNVWEKVEDKPDFPYPEPAHEVDIDDEDEEPYLTEKTVPSLLPPMRTSSYCTVDSLFSSDSIQDDFAHASDWSSWLRKNDKWSTLRSPKRMQKEKQPIGPKRLGSQRGDSGPKAPVRRKSHDDDSDFVVRFL